MDADLAEKVVTRWGFNACGMPAFRVHQAGYPEIEAEGQTPAAAGFRLIELLAQAGDFAGEAWRFRPLEAALIEARRFQHRYTPRSEPIPFPADVDRYRPTASLVGMPKTREEGPPVERFQGHFPDGRRDPIEENEERLAFTKGTGFREWRGRLWLPHDNRVRPGDRACLIRDDGRAGESIAGGAVWP
jgi:hypothetical protein